MIVHSALAEFESSTLVVVYFSDQQVVVAADSLTGFEEPPYSKSQYGCKIVAMNHDTAFAGTGLLGIPNKWSLKSEAMKVGTDFPSDPLPQVVATWSKRVATKFNDGSPSEMAELKIYAMENNGVVAQGIFVSNHSPTGPQITLARLTYQFDRLMNPVIGAEPLLWPPRSCDSPIGPYCGFGKPNEFLEITRLTSDRARINDRKWRTGKGHSAGLRAISIVELASTYNGGVDIGGIVDAIEIRKSRSLRWIKRHRYPKSNQ
jgi:hypothetical protein